MTETPEIETNATTATLPPPAPAPVQPAPKRGNGWTIFFAIVATSLFGLFVALIGVIAVGTVFVAALASGDLDVDIDPDQVEIDLAPTSIEAIPSSITEEVADIEIDLTKIDVAEFQNADVPVQLDVSADFGAITVIVPEELNVSVDASNDLGEIAVLGESHDGFANTVTRVTDDPDAVLDLDLDAGTIEVIRG